MDIELLAQRITSKLGIHAIRYNGTTLMIDNGRIKCYVNGNDEDNAEFVAWSLDRLDELGYEYSISTLGSGEFLIQDQGIGCYSRHEGPTRAAVCVKALLAALDQAGV